MDEQVKREIDTLVKESRDAIVCSIDEEGFPNAKTMFRRKNDGLRTFWLTTNTSAIRTSHWMKRPKACLYFVDHKGFHGLMLTGYMEVLQDEASKKAIWAHGDEMYYPLGPTDPDYSVLRFTAENGNYYHGLRKYLFSVDSLVR